MRVFPNETPYFVDGCDKLFAVTMIHCIHRANPVNRKQCRWTHPFDRLRQLPRLSLRPEFEARQHWIGSGVSCGECRQRQHSEWAGRWESLLWTQKRGPNVDTASVFRLVSESLLLRDAESTSRLRSGM